MRCRGKCCKGAVCSQVGQCAVTFGLGLVCSCFCPVGLIMFVVAVILVILGIALLRAEHNWEVFAMKVVVVKGSKFWGFILRKMFHIKKEA